MKLRAILLILAILSLVMVGAGGFFLNLHLTNIAWEVARTHTDWTASMVRKQVTFYLEQHRRASIAFSGAPQLATALRRMDETALGDANALLDHQCASLEASVCYLMDTGGTTVASSNRDTPVSFVGKNYGFRPYFKEAIAGIPAVYLALGITSKKRGLYFSAPVITSPGEFGGVVVVKLSTDKLEGEFLSLAGIFALTNPKGIVFASNRESWVFRSLSTLSDKDAEAIVESRQFGEKKPSSVGLIETRDRRAIAPNGTNYLMSKQALYIPAGWHITYLFDTAGISTKLMSGVGRVPVESIFVVLFLIITIIVIFLYRKAASDIFIRNQAEAALRESEGRLLEAQRIAHLGNWRWDIVRNTLSWSDEVFHIFGVEPQAIDVTYDAFLAFVQPDDREMVETAVKRALEDNAPYSIDHRIVHSTGEVRIVHEQGEVTYGESGEPIRMDGTVLDITEQKQTEETALQSQARLTEILNIAPEAVITVGADMRIQLFNQGAERIFGYTAEEVLGQSFEILMPEYLRDGHQKHIEEFNRSGDTYRIINRQDILGLRKDGTEFPASASVSKLEIGEEKIFTVMLMDVSERKKTQDTLIEAKEEAEIASRSKSEFLAAMSHDLRTPLNAIIGFSDFISQQYFGPIGDKYQEYAEDIHSSGELLLSLVNDILDLSTIESGKQPLSIEKISITDVVTECETIIKERAQFLGIDLVMKVPKDLPPLYADRRAIMQILLNLLTNSVKYTPEGGKVTLRAKATNEHYTIEVSDTGRGIPADKITTVTEPFVKSVTDPYKTQESTGLGLAIVKSLVELHGGELDIKSTVGKGTTVAVTLPNGESKLEYETQ